MQPAAPAAARAKPPAVIKDGRGFDIRPYMLLVDAKDLRDLADIHERLQDETPTGVTLPRFSVSHVEYRPGRRPIASGGDFHYGLLMFISDEYESQAISDLRSLEWVNGGENADKAR